MGDRSPNRGPVERRDRVNRDEALTRGYLKALDRLRSRYGAVVATAWANLPDHHEGRIPGFLSDIETPTVVARRLTANVTLGYLAGITGSPVNVDLTTLAPVDAEVWRDPFISTWANLEAGAPLAAAVEAGSVRAISTAGEVVSRANRGVSELVAHRDPRIVGWSWTTSANACDWCLKMAAVEWGPTEQNLFSHRHSPCHCTILPITETSAPGRELATAA